MPEEIAGPMSDNEALRRIVSNMVAIESHIKGEYDDIIAEPDVAISLAPAQIRAAQPLAVKTVVSNIGSTPARIYEDGVLVWKVPSGTTAELPLRATGVLTGDVSSGNNLVRVSTYIKNA